MNVFKSFNQKFISVLFSLSIFLGGLFIFSACKTEDVDDYYYRSVNYNDVIVEQNTSDILSMSFFVRPQESIDDLYIEFSFFDSSDNPLIAKSKELGNVNKGGEYSVKLNLIGDDDLTISEFSKISKYRTNYFRGKIKESQEIKCRCSKHNFSNGVTTIKANCSVNGEKILTCNNCNYKKVESVTRKEHSYILWKVVEEPTCVKSGKSWYICRDCAVRIQKITNPTLVCKDNNNDGVCDSCGRTIKY